MPTSVACVGLGWYTNDGLVDEKVVRGQGQIWMVKWCQIKGEFKGFPLVTYTPLATSRIGRTNSPKLVCLMNLNF